MSGTMAPVQVDFFGLPVDSPVPSVRQRPSSPSPARKAQKRSSTDSASSSAAHDDNPDLSPSSNPNGTLASPGAPLPSGPPFICPTCSTSYSRLEYLRRHERRHADIRPFVCDCGKGFSRSDVLSRHKRQCRIVLQIDGSVEAEKSIEITGDSPSKPAKGRRSSAAKPGRPKGSTKAAKAAASSNPSLAAQGPLPSAPQVSDFGQQHEQEQHHQEQRPPPPLQGLSEPQQGGTPLGPSGQDPQQQDQDLLLLQQQQSPSQQQQQQQQPEQQPQDPSAMIDPAIAADSQAQATTAAAITAPNAAYSYATATMEPSFGEFLLTRPLHPLYSQSSFPHAPVHSQISALSHQYYPPSSPESNGSIASRSEHGSPRYTSQGLARHGSNTGSRYGLRTGSFDQYSSRNLVSASTFSTTDAAIWEGLDTAKLPSPSHASTASQTARNTATILASLGFPAASPLSLLSDRTRTTSHLGSDPSFFRTGSSSLSNSTVSAVAAAATAAQLAAGYASTNATSPAFSVASSTETSASSHQSGFAPSGLAGPSPSDSTGFGPSKEPVRFSVSSLGPLSPFSNTALNSSMSPYLSAFSNARDTPLVASPRSGMPGTPGTSGLSSLDLTGQWSNMRPPSRTVSRHNSIHGLTVSSSTSTPTATSPPSDGILAGQPGKTMNKSSSSDRLSAHLESCLRSTGSSMANENSEKPASSNNVPNTTTATTSSTERSNPTNNNQASTLVVISGSTSRVDHPNPFVKTETQQYFDGGALTPGPEAFLLRVQGGQQELRAGINLNDYIFGSSSLFASSSTASNANIHALAPSWDAAFGTSSTNANPNQLIQNTSPANPMGWLMTPSMQQILNMFPASSDKADYFSTSSAMDGSLLNFSDPIDLDGMAVTPSALDKALSDVKNPFFLPPDMFRACYSVQHWNLPPLTRLSMLALHTQQNLLKHFPILHEPTFRIDTTPGCIAFTVCVLGRHEAGRMWWAGEEAVPKTAIHLLNGLKQPPSPDLFLQARQLSGNEPCKYLDEEDGQELVKPVVMREKSEMMLRSFAERCKSAKDRCSVVQSLMLFHCNNLLNSDASTRMVAALSHGSIVSLARQAGMFDAEAEHTRQDIFFTPRQVLDKIVFEAADLCYSASFLASYLPNCPDEEKLWRFWCELEGRRRTAFIIFVMDAVAYLDSGVAALLPIEDIAHLPLPSPDLIWRASTSDYWRNALDLHRGLSLDDALSQLLGSEPRSSPVSDRSEGESASLFDAHGPFARLAMIVALLRGIVHMVEGRVMKVARASPLQKWLPQVALLANGKPAGDGLLLAFKRALSRWRKSWDMDFTCMAASGPNGGASRAGGELHDSLFTPLTASGATPLCDDALPLYWLAHVLVTHAASNEKLPLGSSNIQTVGGDMDGKPATGTGASMPDLRSMLRFAKNFVSRGEK